MLPLGALARTDRSAVKAATSRSAAWLALVLLLQAASLLLLAPCAAGAPAAPPNVLFISIDDLNDWVGFLGGHPQASTPNLDRLAARGVVFTRAYCAAPACNPSRAGVLCGVRPSTSGVYHNDNPWRRALPAAVTLPQHFRAHGYRVAGAGKIFHGGQNDRASWDEYFRQPADPMPPGRPLNGLPQAAHFDWGAVDAPDEAMGDHRVVAWASEYLRRDDPRPFFLAVGLYRPHLPWFVPRRYLERLPPDSVELPPFLAGDLEDVPPAGRRMAAPERDHRRVVAAGQWRAAVAAYLASIAFADAMLGRLLDALEASPHAANTIVVVWGDHGWHLGEKEHWRKFALWERAARVPLIVAGPGLQAGARCGRTVSLLDLYPTLIDLCGLEQRPGLEGGSLVPLLRDPGAPWEQPALTTHGRGNHAVRSERWRYIRYADGSEELYDHDADPNEWTNLASRSELEEVKRELGRRLPRFDADEVRRPAAARRDDAESRPGESDGEAEASAPREVEVGFGTGEWPLSGTLALPAKAGGPVPGVVLVHGSGPQDRDVTILANKPFKDLALALAEKGIAVLRYDKRTHAHKKSLDWRKVTLHEEVIEDAILAARFLDSRPETGKVFVAGHSLGGWCAPLIAKEEPKVAGIILLAAPARGMEEIVIAQSEYLMPLQLVPPATQEKQIRELREGFARLRSGSMAEGEFFLGASGSYWYDFLERRPLAVAKELEAPILVLQGEKDYQVTLADFELWKEALGDKGTFRSFPGLNHIFHKAPGAKSTHFDYIVPGKVDAQVAEAIAAWIDMHAGRTTRP
jgi:arylsulfatase A-like enzyme/fermentation-respiration switch protein FrsA (DUF1100 family)